MRLGKIEPFDPNNPDHRNPLSYVITDEKGKPIPDQANPMSDVFQHTLAAVKKSPSRNAVINLAILLHDVGKPETQDFTPEGKVRYLRHAQKGAEMIDIIAKRLKLDNKTRQSLIFAAENHMKIHDVLRMSNSKVLKLMMDKDWDVLLNVAHADAAARGSLFKQTEWSKIVKKIEKLTQQNKGKRAVANIRKIVTGRLVMDLRRIKGGPEVGRILSEVISWIVNNNIDVEKNMNAIKAKIKEV